ATDLPRLLRGLQLLSQADPAENYVFQTREGPVTLRGATLSALPVEAGELDSVVLYCSDGPEQAAPRLLSAASRMQLLSAPASLAFAARGCPQEDTTALEPVWRELLSEPRWRSVLNQYPALARAMSLMVHTSDLEAALYPTPKRHTAAATIPPAIASSGRLSTSMITAVVSSARRAPLSPPTAMGASKATSTEPDIARMKRRMRGPSGTSEIGRAAWREGGEAI